MPFCTYCESVKSRTRLGRLSASSARITAVSSMRLLVVAASPPHSSFSTPLARSSAPQPPGPGFPRQAPSLKISTASSLIVLVRFLRDRRQRAAPRPLLAPLGRDEAHAVGALDRPHHIEAAGNRPPARPGRLHEVEPVEPQLLLERRRVAAQLAAVQLEAEHAQPVAQPQQADELQVPRRLRLAGAEHLAHPP